MKPALNGETAKGVIDYSPGRTRVFGKELLFMPNDNTRLVRDADIAQRIAMSQSWLRKQRMLRRQGEEHVFAVDPVMIGSSPRYRAEEVDAWLAGIPNEAQLQGRGPD
jgi:predicted DNA-binding transcriptional regulator AlpA